MSRERIEKRSSEIYAIVKESLLAALEEKSKEKNQPFPDVLAYAMGMEMNIVMNTHAQILATALEIHDMVEQLLPHNEEEVK